jgi:predicted patatin/cPLA2 family phospholipase
VWGCAILLVSVAHLHIAASEILNTSSDISLLVATGLLLAATLCFFFRKNISAFSHGFLRLPLRTGLFPNFERTRFLRERIPLRGFRRSPIRVAMTAANVVSGTEKCFTNATHAELLSDPGVDIDFVKAGTTHADDLLMAVIASSAFPIVYETVPMHGKQYTDGGIVGNHPIRPAIRLGADLLFLVMVQPRRPRRGEIKTFLDLGVRAIDILISQNLKTDLKMLNNVNAMCSQYAAELKVRPEQVRLHVGERCYRYLKAFTIAPSEDMVTTVLDFDAKLTAPAIVLGYRDGARGIESFAKYLADLPEQMPKHEVRLVLEHLEIAKEAARTSGT